MEEWLTSEETDLRAPLRDRLQKADRLCRVSRADCPAADNVGGDGTVPATKIAGVRQEEIDAQGQRGVSRVFARPVNRPADRFANPLRCGPDLHAPRWPARIASGSSGGAGAGVLSP